AARDDSAARQREVHLLDRLVCEDLERLARLERSRLAVLQRDVAALARGYRVAAGLDFLELVLAVAVRRREPILAKLGREDANLGFAQRLAGVGRDDVAAKRRGARLGRLWIVAWRRLGRRRLLWSMLGGSAWLGEADGWV